DLVMLAGRYTLLEQGAADDLLPLALERGVGVVIAGVYNTGLLSSARPAAGAKYEYEDAPFELVARANAIADVCERYDVTLPEAALAFPLLHPAVVSVVVGVRDATQVTSNVERYSKPIPADLWTELRAESLLPDSSHRNA
ncbi:MAG TPA: aldo/keto reductase, partial [Galbitalea sp.]|nr:aldo/keto reductase [Galbitalea sp.]